jgi:two-component system response regulator FlrC
MSTRILAVDDREGIRLFVAAALSASGHEVETARDGDEALQQLKKKPFDLLITDLKMPKMDGMALLRAVRGDFPALPVIVLTAFGSIDSAVEAMKLGAFDYLTKPLDSPDQLRDTVRRALALRQPSTVAPEDADGMVAHSSAMKAVVSLIDKVAPTDATVLIEGKSGTGKEVVAREIHRRSPLRDRPFVAVNCAAIAPTLMESELFGHEKGAFTDAVEQRRGRFEMADGGTLFLDEVAELPMAMQVKLLRAIQERRVRRVGGVDEDPVAELPLSLQPKLLRVLQERTFERVGGATPIRVTVRIIAATNRELHSEMAAGRFREDLFHRLAVFPIHLPPLAQRPDDILPLSQFFLRGITARMGTPLQLDEDAQVRLQQHPWPGNVRELANTLERAAILCTPPRMTAADLLFSEGPSTPAAGAGTLRELEKQAIIAALTRNDGHRKRAAEQLGIGLRTLYNKLREYDLE